MREPSSPFLSFGQTIYHAVSPFANGKRHAPVPALQRILVNPQDSWKLVVLVGGIATDPETAAAGGCAMALGTASILADGNDLDIEASVGNEGVNNPDDVSKVKGMLNGILISEGGTEGMLDAGDTSTSGPEFERMAFAIARFQGRHFRGQFEPDGLVEPNRKTIKKLKELFAQGKVVPPFVAVSPLLPTASDTDMLGFSSAGLTRANGLSDWSRRDHSLPITQMVPVGGTRTLVLNFTAVATPRFTIEGTFFAEVTSVVFNMVTVRGIRPGMATLVCSIGAFSAARVNLVVRAPVTKRIDVIHAGAPDNAFAAQQFLDDLLPRINAIFEPQTNIRFTPGRARSITAATFRGTPFSIDPSRELTVLQTGEPTPHGMQGITWDDMRLMIRDPNAITIFMSPRLRNRLNTAVGESETHGANLCWFRVRPDSTLEEVFNTAAHEFGHCLGLRHVNAFPSQMYLMNDQRRLIALENRIPSETLVDLIV